MRTAATFAAGSLLASVASAQFVKWDVQRRATSQPRLGRRDGDSISETIQNLVSDGGYFAAVQVGTPGQKMTLQLDTGSSDVWVLDSDTGACESSDSYGSSDSSSCPLGAFSPSSSSTFETVVENGFQIQYVDGSESLGDYIEDTFQIGGSSITNLTMGLGKRTNIPYGLVGIGYTTNEASISTTGKTYNNLPVVMKNEGLIKTNAYSLWLNDLDASSGNILFGAIDTDKYTGDMMRVDVVKNPASNSFSAFIVNMTSVVASSSSGSDSLGLSEPVSAVLDSGTTFSYLPQSLAEQVWKETGATYDAQSQLALLPCSVADSKGYFSFQFGGDGGPMINVSMSELVQSAGTSSQTELSTEQTCVLGIQNYTSSPYLLGDSFLRSAYVVYDLENNQIGLAQTDFNATTSNVVAFPSEGAQIPSSTAAPNQDAVASGSSNPSNYGASDGFQDKSSGVAAPLAVTAGSMLLAMVGAGLFLLI